MPKHDGVPTLPLFDLPATAGDGVERPQAPRSIAFATCPSCSSGGRGDTNLVGLVRSGEHLVWRDHTVTTWGGARTPCRASGTTVCTNPPRHYVEAARCRHGSTDAALGLS